jgi:DNA-binding response OmpR family regulator
VRIGNGCMPKRKECAEDERPCHGQTAKPPNMYGHLSPFNAVLDRRENNISNQIVHFADVTVDIGRRKIMCGNEAVNVTPVEYNLLLLSVQNIDRPLTRDAILNAAWGCDSTLIPERWMCT